MASVQEVIKRHVTQFTSTGAEKVAADANKVGAAITQSATKQERAALSLEKQFSSLERRFNETVRKQQDYEKVQRQVNAAVAQNPALQARANEVLRAASVHYGQVSTRQALFTRGLQAANDNLAFFASRGGVVIGALAQLGLAGGIAGAGIAGAILAIDRLTKMVNKFADEMGKLRDTSQIIGLNTLQLQALNDAGSAFALTEDKIATALQRFTAQMDDVRRAEGELFNAVRRVDPALAMQLALTRDNAEALDIYARALQRADTTQRAALSRAGLGRTSFDVGLLLQSVAQQGGIAAITREFQRSGDAIDNELIQKVARLRREIQDTSGDASRNLASIFSVELLESELRFVEQWREFTRSAKEFKLSGDWNKLVTDLRDNRIIQTLTAAALLLPGFGLQGVAALGLGVAATTPRSASNVRPSSGWAASIDHQSRGGIGTGFVDSIRSMMPQGGQSLDPRALLNLERQRIAALGEAATAVEQLRLKEMQLGEALRSNVLTQEEYGRALGVARLQTVIQLESRRIALLGESASVESVVAAKQNEINLARAQGVRISEEEARVILQRTRLQTEASRLPNQLAFERDQLFRTDVEASIASRLRSANEPIDLQSATAQAIRLNEHLRQIRDTSLEISQTFSSTLVQSLRNGESAFQALANAGMAALNRLTDKLVQMATDQLVLRALGPALSGLGIGGGGQPAGYNLTIPSARGNVFDPGGIVPFARGGIVDQPTIFPFANGGIGLMGEAGPEAIVPLGRTPSGELGIKAGSQGAPVINVNVVNNAGADVSVGRGRQNADGSIDIEVMIERKINKTIASGSSDAAMHRYGGSPVPIRR